MFEQDMILDRYRVIERAGSGGYGTVQHAFDTRLKRDVAIKCIQLTQADIVRVQHNNYADDAPFHAVDTASRVRPIGSPAKSKLKTFQTRSVYSQRKDVFHASDSAFIPASLPREPGFLNRRDEIAAKRSSVRDRDEHSAREPIDQGLRAPAHTTTFSPPRFAAEQSDEEIYELAHMLPGKIDGAGETTISAVDDDAVEVSAAFEKSFRDQERLQNSQPSYYEDAQMSTVLPIPRFLSPQKKGGTMAFSSGVRPHESTPRVKHRAWRSHRARTDFTPAPRAERPRSTFAERDRYRSYGEGDFVSGSGVEYAPSRARTPERVEYDLDNIPGLEEARTAAHLNDANIVTVYDCVVEGGMAYVIMEYVEGKTLAALLSQLQNDITLDMVASIFSSVAHALEVAHKANVLHLDIKPENVIINRDGVVKVMDFGLSTLMDAGGHGSTGGGTIGYMPLEQMRQQALDVRTDEWALASLTYEMLAGTNPFRARTLPEAEKAIINAQLVLPSKCWDDMDEKIDDVMFSALDPDLDNRYKTVNAFSKKLMPMLGNVKEGKKQLALVVAEEDEADAEEGNELLGKLPPLIDRLGSTGSGIIMRVFAALSSALICAIALMNFRLDLSGGAAGAYPDTTFGVFSTAPLVAWALLVLLVAITALWPRFGLPSVLLIFGITLIFNQAWLTAILMLLLLGAWWWMFGRRDDTACTLILMEPLLGAVGMGAVVPVAAGALMDIKEAAVTAVASVAGALTFASLGSANLMNWDVFSNFIVAINPLISGASITNTLVETLSLPTTWCVAVSWVLAAFLFSLFCRKGTRVFDVIGSVVSALVIIVGALVIPGMLTTAALDPMNIAGALVPAAVAIALAGFGVTDRVRLVEGDVLEPVEDGVDTR